MRDVESEEYENVARFCQRVLEQQHLPEQYHALLYVIAEQLLVPVARGVNVDGAREFRVEYGQNVECHRCRDAVGTSKTLPGCVRRSHDRRVPGAVVLLRSPAVHDEVDERRICEQELFAL